MPFTWFERMLRRPAARKSATRSQAGQRRRLGFDALENRCVPAVTVAGGINGADGNSLNATSPPDTQVSYGPASFIETYSLGVTLAPRNGQFAPITTDMNGTFLAQSSPTGVLSSPFSVYDDDAQRFIIGEIEVDTITQRSWLHFAVSNNSTPTNLMTSGVGASFLETQTLELTETGSALNGATFASDPNVGFNADGVFFTFDMKSFANSEVFDHSLVIPVEARTIFDANSSTIYVQTPTPTARGFDLPAPYFGVVPARMHDAPAGTPEYFVSTYGQQGETGTTFSSTAIIVTSMSNYFTPNPGFIHTTLIVPNFGSATSELNTPFATNGIAPDIIQPGNSGHGQSIIGLDTAIVSVAWEQNHLVAAQTAEVNSQATVQWYEIDTSSVSTAKLIQSGDIAPGPGIYTYAPGIDIGKDLSIGLAYGQSSTIQFPSVYVTGRTQTDVKGKMEAPVEVKAGQNSLVGPVNVTIPVDLSATVPVAAAGPTSAGRATDPNIYEDLLNFYNYSTTYIVDRSGMTPGVFPLVPGTDTASNEPAIPPPPIAGTMWRSDPQYVAGGGTVSGATYDPVVGQTLTFNFGQLVSLNNVQIWNYNNTMASTFADPGNPLIADPDLFVGPQFGAKQIRVFTEPAPGGPMTLIQTLNLQPANGSPTSYFGQNFQLGNRTTQYLVFQFVSNWTTGNSPGNVDGGAAPQGTWGTVGLSEVQFFKNPPPGNRVGNSSLQVDPINQNTFVAANQYGKALVPPPPVENFGTWIPMFRVAPAMTQTLASLSPLRWVALGGAFTGTFAVTNNGSTITSSNNQLFVTIVLPSASIVATGAGGTQVGDLYEIPINGTFSSAQTLRFTVTLLDPLKVPLPTALAPNTAFFV
jgi:hypothetical protein